MELRLDPHRAVALLRAGLVALFVAIFGTGPTLAIAQAPRDQVIGAQKGVSEISLYAKAYDTMPQARMALRQVTFPMDVLGSDGDFLRVNLAGKEVWLDGAELRLNKAVDFTCVADAGRRPKAVASTAGASKGCK